MATAEAVAQTASERQAPAPPEPAKHRSAGRRLFEACEAFQQVPLFVRARRESVVAAAGNRIGGDVTADVESELA